MFYCREPGPSAPVNLSIGCKYFLCSQDSSLLTPDKDSNGLKKRLHDVLCHFNDGWDVPLGKKTKRTDEKISTRDWIDVGLARFRSCKSNRIANVFLLITHNMWYISAWDRLSLFQTSFHCLCDTNSYKCRNYKLKWWFTQKWKFCHHLCTVFSLSAFSFLFFHIMKINGGQLCCRPNWL